jgi:predicted Zn-dependent peptidase
MYDLWTLDNGVRVIGEQLPHLRSCSIGIWVRVGSMLETESENGLSHFIEHMVFKGTHKRSARDIAEEMDAIGGHLNAFTSKDCTCFLAKVIDNDMPIAIDVLCDLLLNAVMDEDDVEKERGVILEEIAMTEDTPEDLVHEMIARAQYGLQSAGMPILGRTEHISCYNRHDIIGFQNKHYRPENVVVSIAGQYHPEEFIHTLQLALGTWTGCGSQTLAVTAPVLGIRTEKCDKDIEQTHVCLGYPGYPMGHDNHYALAVLSSILGGSMSSRLFQRIREEMGMAYAVSSFTSSYTNCGTFRIYFASSPQNAQCVLEQVQAEVQRMVADNVTEKEFRQALMQLRNSYLLGLESASGRMQSIGSSLLLLKRAKTHEEVIRKINNVTLNDLERVACEVLCNKPSMAVVGKKVQNIVLTA